MTTKTLVGSPDRDPYADYRSTYTALMRRISRALGHSLRLGGR